MAPQKGNLLHNGKANASKQNLAKKTHSAGHLWQESP
jgi:hypothetical protein